MRRIRHLLLAAGLSTAVGLSAFADWPQWRGPDRTDVSKETGLLKQWPAGGPKLTWLYKDAGLGYAGYAIVGDSLYTMGARENTEMLIAVNAKDGTQKWAVPMSGMLKNKWGDGPRGTPAVDGDFVYALSGQGTLVCAKAADGTVTWKASMSDLGGKTPGWGYTESVLVDGDKVVCTPGGKKGAMAAFNKTTGDLLWQSKDFTEGAQYSSIIVAEHNGKRQYIQLTQAKLVGIDAENGNVLWSSDWQGKTAVIPTPIFKNGHVYIASGYGVGCKLVKIGPDNKAVDVYKNESMVNHHGGVVLVGDHLYGYSDKGGWTCQEFLSGKVVWSERNKLGKGALTYADGMLYLLEEKSGTVALVEASPKGYVEHGRFTLTPQTEQRSKDGKIWTHPVVNDGKLYLRDQELLFCFDVKAK